jgi:hypothetical protein
MASFDSGVQRDDGIQEIGRKIAQDVRTFPSEYSGVLVDPRTS